MLFQDPPAGRSDSDTGGIATSERDSGNSWIGNQCTRLGSWDKHGSKCTLGETAFLEGAFNFQRRTRNIRGVLENSSVTCHQCWGSKANHLPERIVPRHQG